MSARSSGVWLLCKPLTISCKLTDFRSATAADRFTPSSTSFPPGNSGAGALLRIAPELHQRLAHGARIGETLLRQRRHGATDQRTPRRRHLDRRAMHTAVGAALP